MNALKNLYFAIALNMRKVVIAFVVIVLGLAFALPPELVEAHLLDAWGVCALFSLFLWFGDYPMGWFDEIKDEF